MLKELKPDGIMSQEEEVLSHLDRDRSGESIAVPVKYNKNGSLAKGSKTVPKEDFRALMEYAVGKVSAVHQEITEGNTAVRPYRKGQETGCDYCKFRHVCGFDLKVPGYAYRELDKMSREEAIDAMKREKGEGEK